MNAPIMKPLVILVLAGTKKLGQDGEMVCQTGSFLFLANSPTIDMRNIPDGNNEYCAILIEFDYSDFDQFNQIKHARTSKSKYFMGEIGSLLYKNVQQYIEWVACAPSEVWHFRKKELLQLFYQLGHEAVSGIAEHPSLSHQLHDIINSDISGNWTMDRLAAQLSISESTLRRKLASEGNNIQDIMNQARLGYALYLVQTTMEPIGRIAERCGYHSQSRFTTKFKKQFGIAPTELRKTRQPGS